MQGKGSDERWKRVQDCTRNYDDEREMSKVWNHCLQNDGKKLIENVCEYNKILSGCNRDL